MLRFKIDRQELKQLFNYKRFKTGEYQDWVSFIKLNRSGQHHHDFDIVEGPYASKKNTSGKYNIPNGHQLGLFSENAVKYFDNHIISMKCQLPRLLENLSLD